MKTTKYVSQLRGYKKELKSTLVKYPKSRFLFLVRWLLVLVDKLIKNA